MSRDFSTSSAKNLLPKILMTLLDSPQDVYHLTSIFFDEEVNSETLKSALEAKMHQDDPNKEVIFVLYGHFSCKITDVVYWCINLADLRTM